MDETKEKVGFFKRLGIAIARPREYGKLANQSVGNTIGTFFIVTLVQVIILMILIILLVNFVIGLGDKYIPQIPEFTITDGQLVTENKEPMIYKTEGSEMLFILDANIVLDEIQSTYANEIFASGEYMAIVKDGLIMREGTTVQSLTFEKMTNDVYTKSNLLEFYDLYIKGFFKTAFLISMFIFLTIVIFTCKLIGGLIFGLFGWFVASIQDKKLSFAKLFNIAMYAGVTTALMFILGGFILFIIPMWTGVKFVIISLYIIFAIKNIPSDTEKNNI